MSKPRRGRRGAGYGARDNAAPGSGPGSSRHGRDVLSRKKRTKPPAIRPGAFPNSHSAAFSRNSRRRANMAAMMQRPTIKEAPANA